MNVDELSGADLDLEVAKCEGGVFHMRQYSGINPGPEFPAIQWRYDWQELCNYNPSTDWEQGGPIIQREKIGVWWATHFVDDEGNEYGNHWYAEIGCTDENADSLYCGVTTGPTPLIAAMRCYVASKQGEQ